jgi:hypothetical protein
MEATTLNSDATNEASENLATGVSQDNASHPSEPSLGIEENGDISADGSTEVAAKKLSVKEQTEADMANLGKRVRKRLEKYVQRRAKFYLC